MLEYKYLYEGYLPPLFSGWGGFFIAYFAIQRSQWKKNGKKMEMKFHSMALTATKGEQGEWKNGKNFAFFFIENRAVAKYKIVNRQ